MTSADGLTVTVGIGSTKGQPKPTEPLNRLDFCLSVAPLGYASAGGFLWVGACKGKRTLVMARKGQNYGTTPLRGLFDTDNIRQNTPIIDWQVLAVAYKILPWLEKVYEFIR